MKRRIDKRWRGWGLAYHQGSWLYLSTPLLRFGVDNHRRVTTQGFTRGRCNEHELRIPLGRKAQFTAMTKGDDYLTLVGGPKHLRNTNWLIDEFDHSFNALAIASLRYHLDYSVCDNECRRERYEGIIARLSEREPRFTDDEMAVLHPPGWKFEDDFEPLPEGGSRLRESTPERSAIYEAHWQREKDWEARVDQARHDFVDIMRHLWS